MSSQANMGSVFMPPQASELASHYDQLYGFLLAVSVLSFVLVVVGLIYFVVQYRRKSPSQKSAYITHNHLLEFLWSFLPFVIFMVCFGWGWWIYRDMRSFPDDSLEVEVFAKKWDWKFVYKNGKESISGVDASNNKSPAYLVVPVGRPVKLVMTSTKINPASEDPNDRAVIHSFFIPALRVKQDVVPGRYTALGFTADKIGEFNVFCAEYCGSGHSSMRAIVKVVSSEDFDKWLKSDSAGGMSLADKGRALFSAKACIGCHSLDGSRIVGPTFKGLWGRTEDMEGGQSVKVDAAYIRESILEPNAKIVKSYPSGQMPVFKGQVSDEEISAIIEFIKTIK